jgi:hypothetical protein
MPRVIRSFATIVLFAGAAACVKAQTLHGRIVDCQTQSPVEGADVQLSSQAEGASWNLASTGSDGAFAFEVRNPAAMTPLSLMAVKKGYRSAQKTFDTLPGDAQDVCMPPTLR